MVRRIFLVSSFLFVCFDLRSVALAHTIFKVDVLRVEYLPLLEVRLGRCPLAEAFPCDIRVPPACLLLGAVANYQSSVAYGFPSGHFDQHTGSSAHVVAPPVLTSGM